MSDSEVQYRFIVSVLAYAQQWRIAAADEAIKC